MQIHFRRFQPFFPAQAVRRNRLRWRAVFRSMPERSMASCAGWSSTPSWVTGSGHLEGAVLEPLVPDRQTVAVKVEDLDPIPAAVEEEEEMAGQGVLVEAFLDQARKGRRSSCGGRWAGCRERSGRPRGA